MPGVYDTVRRAERVTVRGRTGEPIHAYPPLPDGSCDLTAHVAMDSLRADTVRTQREVLRDLGVDGTRPPLERAHTESLQWAEQALTFGAEQLPPQSHFEQDEAMESHGFTNYANEWWHYTVTDEPYPDTYFDFPVTRRSLSE